MKQFAHLHVHTEFSILDGAVRTDKVFGLCDELGISAIAMTDHGNLYGTIDFLKAAVRHTDKDADFYEFMKERRPFKVKPIIGCEIEMIDDMLVKEKGANDTPNRLVLLAKNGTGYHNLIKIVSAGYIAGTYEKPRMDFNLITAHSEGLIALSGGLSGVIAQEIMKKRFVAADGWVKQFKTVFGEDFYIEIQNQGIAEQKTILPHLIRLAKENSVKVVATNNAHYLTKADAEVKKVLRAISTRSTIESGADVNDKDFATDEFYLKTYNEMYAALPYEDALAVSLEIANKCDPYLMKAGELSLNILSLDEKTDVGILRELEIEVGAVSKEELLGYITHKYGVDKVAKLATYGKFVGKSVIKDVGRAYGYSYPEIESITKLVPFNTKHLALILGLVETENDELISYSIVELRKMYENSEMARKILDMAMKIEGMPRLIRAHAAKLVISRDAIYNHVPLLRTYEGELAVQFYIH